MKRLLAPALLCFVMITTSTPAQEIKESETFMPQVREETKQFPPKPGEGKEVYLAGMRPFLWVNHGASPYFPAPDRDALVRLSQNGNLVQDLTSTQQAFAKLEAEFIKNALAHAKDSDSIITEVILPVDTPIQRMRLKTGVEPMVILKGKPEPSWQIILPPELGSKVVWIPKVCGNICLSPFPAQTQTFVFKTEVQEREKERVVEKPVYIERPVYRTIEKSVYVDRPIFVDRPVYQESGPSRCGKKCKIALVVLGVVGASAGTYFGTRGHEKPQVQTVIPPIVAPYKPPGGGGGVN